MKKILFCYFHPSKKSNYTPLDMGFISAIIEEKNPSHYNVEMVCLYYSEDKKKDRQFLKYDVDLIKYHQPDAIFFFLDNILWSGNYGKNRAEEITKEIKRALPKIFVGFQSHKIQENEIGELLKNGTADCIVGKSPEYSFQFINKILEKEEVSGVAHRNDAIGEIHDSGEKKFPEDNLDELPSPYLSGVFDNFLLKKQIDFSGLFRAYLYSSRGCPYGCYYCFRSVKYEKVRFFSAKRLFDEADYLSKKFGIKKFFILDDSFSLNEKRLQELICEFEKRKGKNPALAEMSIDLMLRPETISPDNLKLLKKLNVAWVQIGLQTINPELQEYMTRRIPVSKFSKISNWLKESGINLHFDIMMGPPNDTLDYFQKTVDFALNLDPFSIQIKQLYLNPGTLFYNAREKYNLHFENSQYPYFRMKPVVCSGLEKDYYAKANEYVKQKISLFPKIKWKFVSREEHFISHDFA